MSLPKKFNETVNLNNRIKSFNDLTFYIVKYDYTINENHQDEIENFDIEKEVTGVKEFYALNEQQVSDKITNWFLVLSEKGILSNYKITSIEDKSFYDTIKEKNLI